MDTQQTLRLSENLSFVAGFNTYPVGAVSMTSILHAQIWLQVILIHIPIWRAEPFSSAKIADYHALCAEHRESWAESSAVCVFFFIS